MKRNMEVPTIRSMFLSQRTRCIQAVLLLALFIMPYGSMAQAPPERYVAILFNNLEIGPSLPESQYFMFNQEPNGNPYVASTTPASNWYANQAIRMNLDGSGDESCTSQGSGKATTTATQSSNVMINGSLVNTQGVSALMSSMDIVTFEHVNVVNPANPWDTLNQAGDVRTYGGQGVYEIYYNGDLKYRATNVTLYQNLTYPQPAGSIPGTFAIVAYLLGAIDKNGTDPTWLAEMDPTNTGVFYSTLNTNLLGPKSCYSYVSYVINTTGIIDTGQTSGDGPAPSTQDEINVAEAFAVAAVAVGGGASLFILALIIIILFAALIVTTMASAALESKPPGQGINHMLRAAQYFALLGHVRNAEYSEAYIKFTSGLDPFLCIFNAPWQVSSSNTTSRFSVGSDMIYQDVLRSAAVETLSYAGFRQDNQTDNSTIADEDSGRRVSEQLIAGTAFTVFLVVICTATVISFGIWFGRRHSTRTKWTVYSFLAYLALVIINWVYAGALMLSVQYLATNPSGSGSPGGYAASSCLLVFVGVGLLVPLFWVLYVARGMAQREELVWVPKKESDNPEVQNSKVLAGEWITGEENTFHLVYACWYDGYKGRRLWIFYFEWCTILLMALIIGVVDAEEAVLIIVMLFAVLTALFYMFLMPYADKIEQTLVTMNASFEMMVAVLSVVSAFVKGDAKNKLQSTIVYIAFMGIVNGISLAVYCDLIAALQSAWELIKIYREYRANGSLAKGPDEEKAGQETPNEVLQYETGGEES